MRVNGDHFMTSEGVPHSSRMRKKNCLKSYFRDVQIVDFQLLFLLDGSVSLHTLR
ncbi:MAG: hypothetical protein ACI9R3_006280 [Verrucomicrobiales bacterium]|jgi:hypothetical protein